jgi:hypothetical protein
MKNKDGKYEAAKFFSVTNQEIVGIGNTMAQAKEDLKKKVEAYRNKPLEISGLFNSPGYEIMEVSGRRHWSYNPDRKGIYWARPELAEYLMKTRNQETK